MRHSHTKKVKQVREKTKPGDGTATTRQGERGEGGKWGKNGTNSTEHTCSDLKEETEARRGDSASEMAMVHTDEARRGSFNARIKGLGMGWERHSVFRVKEK